MFALLTKIKGSLKKIILFGCLFLAVFAILFYLANLDLKTTPEKTSTIGVSFAGKIDPDFKKKIGSTDISVLTYEEWAGQYGLNGTNDKYEEDPDSDFLPNYLEYAHLTNPKNSDTDGDGFTDRQEITNGYDPAAKGDSQPAVEVSIGKIGVVAPLVWSKSEDEKIQLEDLKNGISHYPKTASPGQSGNAVISGHSSNYIWAEGNYNHIFKDLNALQEGDLVDIKTIQQNGRVILYHYKVGEKKIVWPDDESIFQETPNPTLTLSTCWPLGTNFKRLIVKADLVK